MFEKRAELLTKISIMLFCALMPYYVYWIWAGWNPIVYFDLLNLIPLSGVFFFIRRKRYEIAAFLIVLIPLMNVYEYDEGFSGRYGYYYNYYPIMLANIILFTRKERMYPIIGISLSVLVFIATNIPGLSPRIYSIYPEHAPDEQTIYILNFISSMGTSLVGTGFLIKAYQKTAERLKKSLESAEELAELKTQFLSNMSHEIRTPMNAVIGMTNLMIEEHPRKDQLERLQVLKFSADNLLHIINDILDYSKLEAGKVSLEQKPFSLKELIGNVHKGFLPQADSKGLKLELVYDERIPNLMKGDLYRLTQVLNNLVNNAIKFTELGYVRISAKLEDSGGINFSVEDTGIGIPEDKLQFIFERFSQVQATTTRKHGGTGLGLAISSKLIELQNARLNVESSLGKGTRFSFTLRFEPLPETELELLNLEKIPTHHPLNCAILLAEDNPINQLVARNFIEKWGAELDIASNGAEALAMVRNKHYDLILMDLQMPEMDGYEATRRIRLLSGERFSRIPIIALTASSIVEVQEQYIRAGMNNYMRKPFVPEELYQLIAHYVWEPRVINLPSLRAS